jgi:hypothetical protein
MVYRIAVWLVLSLTLASVFAVLGWQTWDLRQRTATLSNGRQIQFLAAAVGTIQYDSYTPVGALLQRTLPSRQQSLLGPRDQFTAGYTPPGEKPLLLLFRCEGDDGRFCSRVEFTESNGFVHVHRQHGYTSTRSQANGMFVHWSVDAFPRREPTLRIVVYENETDRKLLDIVTDNPGYQENFPVPQALSLPARLEGSPLAVTLKEIKVTRWKEESYLLADVAVETDDPSWERPQVGQVFRDATGNRGRWLSPFEPVWLFEAVVRRRDDAPFPEAMVWRIPNVAWPKPGEPELQNDKTTLQSIPLRFIGLCQNATLVCENGEWKSIPVPKDQPDGDWSSLSGDGRGELHVSQPALVLEQLASLPDGATWVIRVLDEAGQDLNAGSSSTFQTNSRSLHTVRLKPQGEAKTLQIEIKYSPAEVFRFPVKPLPPEAMGVTKVTR